MIKRSKYIILTEVHDIIDFFENEYDEEIVIDLVFKSDDDYTIPRLLYILTEDSLREYMFMEADVFNAMAGSFKYSMMGEHCLNNAGKEQYNIYNMMYSDGDNDDTWIDVKEFIDKYIEDFMYY